MCTLTVQSTEGQRSALPRSLLDGVQDIEDGAGLTFYLLFTTFYRSHHGVTALLKFSMYQTILCLMISYNNVK